MERTLAEVGRLFRDRRIELGLTQVQIVERAEAQFGHKAVGESTYRQFESGRAESISPRTTIAASVAVGWPKDAVDRLLAGEDPAALAPENGDHGEPTPAGDVEHRLTAVESDLAEVRRGVEELLRRVPPEGAAP